LGGHVRKGERGVTVCYADRLIPKDARGGDGGAKGDNRAIFRASSQASKAADFLLAFRPGTDAAADVGEVA